MSGRDDHPGCPYYHLVPKDLKQQCRYRSAILKRAVGDAKFQAAVMEVCRRDILFFINTFVMTHAVKARRNKIRPFNTWPFQDDAITKIRDAVNDHDLHIEKSRDMGASWMVLVVFLWFWLFVPYSQFFLLSRKKELVDSSDNFRALMPKLDIVLKYLPEWMKPPHVRTDMHLFNSQICSAIDGDCTTQSSGRGGRDDAMLVDEMPDMEENTQAGILSATRDTTDCRIMVGTPNGPDNPFAVQRNKYPPEWRLRLIWTDNPIKARDMYWPTPEEGQRLLYFRPGEPRSPWFDLQCRRALNEQEINKEIRIDYSGSVSKFFSAELIEKLMEQCLPPIMQGDLAFDDRGHPVAFHDRDAGIVSLWCPIEANGRPPASDYVIGIDVAAATGGRQHRYSAAPVGASNSTGTVLDLRTGRKVAEVAVSGMSPHYFAEVMVAVGHWFYDAYVIWEANGPGLSFGQRFIELEYGNFYMRRQEEMVNRPLTHAPGFWTSPKNKVLYMAQYLRALQDGKFIQLSREAVEEMRYYCTMPDSTIQHRGSMSTKDPTGAKSNHGDRIIADAMAWWAAYERSERPIDMETKGDDEEAPRGSMAWRMRERKRERSENVFDLCGLVGDTDS